MGVIFLTPQTSWGQTPPKSRHALTLSHTNDADLLGGNDEGFTFKNQLRFDGKWERGGTEEDIGPLEMSLSFATGLFTRRRVNEDSGSGRKYEHDRDGRTYLDFIEEFRLSCGFRDWDSKEENRFWEYGCDVTYESSDESATGTALQDTIHSWAGLSTTNGNLRVYNYDDNQIDRERFGVEAWCARGARLDLSRNLFCDVKGGARLDSNGLDESSLDLGTKLMLHSSTQSAFERDHAAIGTYVSLDCKQYLDFENHDARLSIGVRAEIPGFGRSKWLCRVEWTKPLSVSDSLRDGMDDRDQLITLDFGVSW